MHCMNITYMHKDGVNNFVEVEAGSNSITCLFLNQKFNKKEVNVTYHYGSYLSLRSANVIQTSDDQVVIGLETQNEAEDYNFHVTAKNIDRATIVNVEGTYSGKY